MKIGLLLFFILSGIFVVNSQEITKNSFIIGLTGGYGQYIQKDLKKLNQDIKEQLNFETELIDNFPPYIYYGVYFLNRLTAEAYFGINYQYHTTGSRLGYKDFSGSYAFDQILSNHSVAIRLDHSLTKNKKLMVFIDYMGGFSFTSWELLEQITIGNQTETSSEKLIGITAFINPSVRLRYPIMKNLFVSLSAGYNLDIVGRYKVKGTNNTKSNIEANWSGFRTGINMGFAF